MKHLKSIALLFAMCLCSNGIMAETRKDSLYIQLFGGVNKSANENLPFTEVSPYPFSVGCFLGLGSEFSPLWGWRTSLGFNHNKSRNVEKCESNQTWGWNDVELFGDVTFDITDAVMKRMISPKFNLKAFAGVGGLWTFDFPSQTPLSYTYPYSKDSKINMGLHAGITASWQLSSATRLGAELSHTWAHDQFNGVTDHKEPLDGRSNLSVGITWMLNNKKTKKKRKPIIYANRLKDIPNLPLMIPSKETNKNRQLEGKAYLDFPVNEIVIYPTYRNNPHELKKIRASIDQVRFDTSVVITSVGLHGYASPESPYSNNERLAKGRTQALVRYLKDTYKLSAATFKTKYTPEDWGNLRKFVADSLALLNPSLAAYRKELLQIIDSNVSPDPKEELLKQVGEGKPYKWLYQFKYPSLRHTDYTVSYTIKEYPIKEARKLIYTHPEALSLDEIYGVAVSYYENSDGYFEALMIGAKQYPDNAIANLNAACACIRRRKLKDARAYAQKAGTLQDAQYVINVIDAMEGKVKWHLENNKLILDD